MARLFYCAVIVAAFLAVLFIAIGSVGGCNTPTFDAWRQSHPTTQITAEAGKVAAAGVESAVTGSVLPVAKQAAAFLGWLLTIPAGVQAVRSTAKVRELTKPWDRRTERRERRRPPPDASTVIPIRRETPPPLTTNVTANDLIGPAAGA